MVFLVVVPILAGFGNFLVPLMIGARDMAFPRLNAFSYWMFLFGGVVLYSSFFAKGGPAKAGWTAYVAAVGERSSAAGTARTSGSSRCHLLAISSLAGAINFIATIHNMRAPGMTWTRMPLFVWSIEVYAVPARRDPAGDRRRPAAAAARPPGRDALLHRRPGRQRAALPAHLLVLRPPRGVRADPARRWGSSPRSSPSSRASRSSATRRSRSRSVGIAFISMLVWAHHMFAVGLGWGLQSFFMIATMLVAVPTGREDPQLARDDLARQPDLRHADAVRARLHRDLHDRRPDRDLPGGVPARLAGARHVLRRRALPLHAVRRLGVRDLRRAPLLVAEDVRPDARRAAREDGPSG